MKITHAIAAYAVLATTASAIPFSEEHRTALERRHARRAAIHQASIPSPNGTSPTPSRVDATAASSPDGPGGYGGYIFWNQNGVTEVEAKVTVPTPAIPPNGDASGVQYGGAAWVGIENNSGGVLWQTGVTWDITGSTPSYYAWYEWVPGGSSAYTNDISFGAGDQIYLKVTTTSATSGTAYVENLSTGQSATQTLTGQQSLGTVQAAEFLLEDYGSGSGSIPFASFSPAVQFTDCSFTDSTGSGQGITGASVMNVGSSSHPFTSTTMNSDSSFTVTYTGDASYS